MGLPHSSEVVRRASPKLDLLTGMCMVMFVNTYLTSQSCLTLHFIITDYYYTGTKTCESSYELWQSVILPSCFKKLSLGYLIKNKHTCS